MATAPTQARTTVARGAEKAGDAVVSGARSAAGPARTIGLAAAGLAGGVVLGVRLAPRRKALGFLPAPRRKVLGVPIGRKPASVAAAHAFADGVRRLAEASGKASRTAEDVHDIREQLKQANRQSPVEVLLDGLTHRRGAHRGEN